jgi:hypothetical protein
MAELSGLAAIRAYKKQMKEEAEAREARQSGDLKKPQYLKLEDGQSVKVMFLQEMDTDSKNYDPKRGIGMGAIEHAGLDGNFKFRGLCTIEDGKCWPCEKRMKAKKGDPDAKYTQRKNYYINALVDFGDGSEPETWVLSRGLNSSFIADLMDEVDETETIMGKTFKVARRGSGTDTTWSLRELRNDTTFESVDVDAAHVFDIEKEVLKSIPYETDYIGKMFGQSEFYTQSPGDWKKKFLDGDSDSDSGDSNVSTSKETEVGDNMTW